MTIKRHSREELEALSASELVDYVMQLEEQLTSDSTNSSKPPSKDGEEGRKKRKKNKSLRKSGEREQGGQDGHPGATLQPREKPDVEIPLPLKQCPICKDDLSEENQTGRVIKRQVFDLPEPPPLECTEYNAPEYQCENCECFVRLEQH